MGQEVPQCMMPKQAKARINRLFADMDGDSTCVVAVGW